MFVSVMFYVNGLHNDLMKDVATSQNMLKRATNWTVKNSKGKLVLNDKLSSLSKKLHTYKIYQSAIEYDYIIYTLLNFVFVFWSRSRIKRTFSLEWLGEFNITFCVASRKDVGLIHFTRREIEDKNQAQSKI